MNECGKYDSKLSNLEQVDSFEYIGTEVKPLGSGVKQKILETGLNCIKKGGVW